MKEFDETDAVAAMRKYAGEEVSAKYSDDQLLNVLDMIWDYYEINGMLDIDVEDADDAEGDIVDDLCQYVARMVKKDTKAGIDAADIEPLVRGELDYEESLDPLI